MEHLIIAFRNSPRCSTARLNYGTAGFRSNATNLPHAMFRCGIIAALRSMSHGGQAVGICITASHNPENDNGAKIVEPDGGMLSVDWEKYATDLVNCGDNGWQEVLEKICVELFNASLAATLSNKGCLPLVVVARDTRPSSYSLATAAIHGIRAIGGQVIDCKEATTPMLHWGVTFVNDHRTDHLSSFTAERLHSAYYKYFETVLTQFLEISNWKAHGTPSVTAYCDAACGVGGPCIVNFSDAFGKLDVTLEVLNLHPTDEVKLNDSCGAEHVQKGRALPLGAEKLPPSSHCFSMDGDADRVVFFLTPGIDNRAPFRLLDGDRIAAIAAVAFLKLWHDLIPHLPKDCTPFTLGIVQTAYANGGSTNFLRRQALAQKGPLEMSVKIAKTGVKNVHKLALLTDVGIWFESNGHGTVTSKFKKIDQWAIDNGVEKVTEWKALRAYLSAYNWCVGDAMVDALCFELCLRILKLTLQEAYSYYRDLEVVQAKIPMSREKLDQLKAHPEHELWLISPKDVQDELDAAVREIGGNARAFVRASGTEDVCRIYAEAETLQEAQSLETRIRHTLQVFNST